jgi:hypothetical protein
MQLNHSIPVVLSLVMCPVTVRDRLALPFLELRVIRWPIEYSESPAVP